MSGHKIDVLEAEGRIYHPEVDGPVTPNRPGHARFCPFCGQIAKRDFWQSNSAQRRHHVRETYGAEFVCTRCGAGYSITLSGRAAREINIARQAEGKVPCSRT